MNVALRHHRPSLRLGARSYLAQVLAPEEPLEEWLAELQSLSARSPGFFTSRPVVLDLSGSAFDRPTLNALLKGLAERNIRVMALEGGSEGGEGEAGDADLPPLIRKGRQTAEGGSAAARADGGPVNLMISEPVRSGQSIYCPRGDVTVLAAIASGAEVVAGGSIHVYGALRGRALAGANGEAGARIFCQSFDAELIAVNGVYLTAEDADPAFRGQAIQAWHENGVLRMAGLKRPV
ncbi:MAG: septum site-determining protein MinC [Bauldia sp.]